MARARTLPETFRLRFRGKPYELIAPINGDDIDSALEKAVKFLDFYTRADPSRRVIAELKKGKSWWTLVIRDAEKGHVIETVLIK
ncbi:MAG: hypothetical protein ACTSVD_06770 [Candidatus Thorarchaeota archaeon]